MSKNIIKGNIGNALHDVSPDHIVATADEIFDEQRQQYQETINERVGDYVENPEFVEVSVDSSNHVLYGVQEDGNFYFGAGVPNQIQTELDSLSDKIDVDVSTAINELRNDLGFYTDSPEFVRVNIDASNKVLYGVQNDGNFYFGAGVPNQVKDYVDSSVNRLDGSVYNSLTDVYEKISDLDTSINNLGFYEDSQEFVRVNIDASNKVLYGVQNDGNFYFGCGVPSQIASHVASVKNDLDNEISTLDNSTNIKLYELETKVDASLNDMYNHVDSSIKELGYYEDNPEFVRVNIDASNKILYGVQNDGNFYFGAGVPNQVTGYVEDELSKRDASISKIEHRYFDVNEYYGAVGINYTLEEAIALVPEEYQHGGLILSFNSEDLYQLDSSIWDIAQYNWSILQKAKYVNNPEYIEVTTDSSSKVIQGIKSDGTTFICGDLQVNGSIINDGIQTQISECIGGLDTEALNSLSIIDSPEFIEAKIDSSGRFIEGINRNGEKIFGIIPPQIKQYIDENIPIGGSGVQSIEYDEITGDMYATYDSSGGVTDVNMESNGDIYVEYEE